MKRTRRVIIAASAVVGMSAVVTSWPGSPSGAATDVVSVATAPALVETVTVQASSQSPTSNVIPLTGGHRYLFEVSGTDSLGGGNFADAECSWTSSDSTRTATPTEPLVSQYGEGAFDLLVDEQVVAWTPTIADEDDGRCNATDGTYTYLHHQAVNGNVRFRIADIIGAYGDNTGALTVQILDASNLAAETEQVGDPIEVPAFAAPTVATSTLSAGRYILEATGRYITDPSVPWSNDAECTSAAQAPGVRDIFTVTQTPTDPTNDLFDLLVDGRSVAWEPVSGTPLGCDDEGHLYRFAMTVTDEAKTQLRINDPYPGDNSGSLSVRVLRIVDGETSDDGDTKLADEVTVESTGTGTTSHIPLEAGRTYTLEASGTWSWDPGYGGKADAYCTRTPADATWETDRYTDDLLELFVEGSPQPWTPEDADGDCAPARHVYRTTFTPAASGLVRFRLNDPYPSDNTGAVRVRIFLDEVPTTVVVVDSRDPKGVTTVPLTAGVRYRMVASGTYNPATPLAWAADAECSKSPTDGWKDHRLLDPRYPEEDLLDVYVDGEQITWTPASGEGTCDADNRYIYEFRPSRTAGVRLAVVDTVPTDNLGTITISIYAVP